MQLQHTEQQHEVHHHHSLIWSHIQQAAAGSAGTVVVLQEHDNVQHVLASSSSSPPTAQRVRQERVVRAAARLAHTFQRHFGEQQQQGGPPVVALLLPRSLQYVVAATAALAAGAAFMPLDALGSWPLQRLQQLLAQVRPCLLVHAAGNTQLAAAAAAGTGCALLSADDDIAAWCSSTDAAEQRLGQQEQQQHATTPRDSRPLPFFCVLPTSGSTGRPVCVKCTEQGFLNRFQWMQQQQQQENGSGTGGGPVALQPGQQSVVAFKTSTTFVDSLWELLAPLLAGATMLLLPDSSSQRGDQAPRDVGGAVSLQLQPRRLVSLLTEHGVTHLAAVPSVLGLWLPELLRARGNLRLQQLVSSGEPLSTQLAARLLDALPPGCVLLNLFGCTEVSADATWQVVTRQLLDGCSSSSGHGAGSVSGSSADAWVPAGRPICNMAVAVVPPRDDDAVEAPAGTQQQQQQQQQRHGDDSSAGSVLQVLPAGQVGEVVIAGTGLAAGYLQQQQPTPAAPAASDRFVMATPCSSSSVPRQQQQQAGAPSAAASLAVGPGFQRAHAADVPRMWFRTGDLGSLDAAGVLAIRGRCSLQVKVRGVRVDLQEVEAALQQHPLVREAAASAVGAGAHVRLVAYVALHVEQHHQQQQPGSSSGGDWQQQLRSFLSDHLHEAARPGRFILVPQLPRSAAGKVLRSQLPSPDSHEQEQQQDAEGDAGAPLPQPAAAQAPAGRKQHSEVAVMHAMLAALHGGPGMHTAAAVRTVLEPTDNFFTAGGGDSLAAAAVAAALGIDVRLVFAYPSARGLSAFLRAHQHASGSSSSDGDAAAKPEEVLAPPAAKRPRLQVGGSGSAAADAALDAARLAHTLPELLAAACTAVVVGAGSRATVWQLGGGDTATPLTAAAAAAAAAAPDQARGAPAVHWRLPLGRCIDAAPLVLVLLRPAQGDAPAGQQQLLAVLAFACSHDGSVVCVDVPTGAALWTTALPARADTGMCLSRCCTRLGVAAGDALFCLSTADGSECGSLAAGGPLRAPPCTDPWCGLWWLVTHSKQLLLVQPDSLDVLSRLDLPAAGSAAVSFVSSSIHTAPGASSRLALVGLLDGSLLAVRLKTQEPAAASPGSSRPLPQQQQQPSSLLEVLWRWQAPAPIFSSPAVQQGSGDAVVAVVAAVSGAVSGVDVRTGKQLWQVQLGAQAFADVLPLRVAQHHHQQPHHQASLALVCTQAGQLHGLHCDGGRQAFVTAVGAGASGVSAAPAVALSWLQLGSLQPEAAAAGDDLLPAGLLRGAHGQPPLPAADKQAAVICCSRDGSLDVLLVQGSPDGGGQPVSSRVMQAATLPGQLFSSPVVVGPCVLMGCRDDHLYCCTIPGML